MTQTIQNVDQQVENKVNEISESVFNEYAVSPERILKYINSEEDVLLPVMVSHLNILNFQLIVIYQYISVVYLHYVSKDTYQFLGNPLVHSNFYPVEGIA